MKRMIALLLCVAALLALAACGEKAAAPDEHAETGTADEETAATVGGWKRPDSPVVTEELCAKLEKALDGLVGARYTPVAYLGSQLECPSDQERYFGVLAHTDFILVSTYGKDASDPELILYRKR